MRIKLLLLALSLSFALAPATARAAFHLMNVVEVFPGTASAPNAQYVVLQMYAGGQNLVSGHTIHIADDSGTNLASFSFPGSVANGANQARILVATPEAAVLFGVTADLTMTPVIPSTGGRVCFDSIDCVTWGTWSGSTSGTGNPFAPRLVLGKALVRRLDVSGSPAVLEIADDTNDSANDFELAAPAPRNNAGVLGTSPSSTCGNSTIEGLEECDDGNLDPEDGCDSLCSVEFCGDGATTGTEECDDGNILAGDGCSDSCTVEVPFACTAAPIVGCRAPTQPLKAQLFLKDDGDDDLLMWKWLPGAETAPEAFGNPLLNDDYVLCVYDDTPTVILDAFAPAAGLCGANPCWKASGNPPGTKGFKRTDPTLTPDGLQQVLLKPGLTGKAKIILKGKGANLDLPMLPLTVPLVVQLQAENGECWGATYSNDGVVKSDAVQFKAKAD